MEKLLKFKKMEILWGYTWTKGLSSYPLINICMLKRSLLELHSQLKPYLHGIKYLNRRDHWRTKIQIFWEIQTLFSKYPIIEYKYWVLTKQIYSSTQFVILILPNIWIFNLQILQDQIDKIIWILFHEWKQHPHIK